MTTQLKHEIVWIGHDTYAAMAERIMLAVQQRVTPHPTWQETRNRYQTRFVLPYHRVGKDWLDLIASVSTGRAHHESPSLYISLEVHRRLERTRGAEPRLASWLLRQIEPDQAWGDNEGELCCFRGNNPASKNLLTYLRHEGPDMPSGVRTDYAWPYRPLLIDDIVTVVQAQVA